MAKPLFTHDRNSRVRSVDYTHDVQIDKKFPYFKGNLLRWEGHSHPGDIEHKIEMSVKSFCRLNEPLHLVEFCHVYDQGKDFARIEIPEAVRLLRKVLFFEISHEDG